MPDFDRAHALISIADVDDHGFATSSWRFMAVQLRTGPSCASVLRTTP